MKLLIIHYWLK